MIKPINKDIILLKRKSIDATKEDISIGQDLKDTLLAHKNECVGMAANMIGETKRIIVVLDKDKPLIMYNPEIIKCSSPYTTKESCLSLQGERETQRYEKIKVQYQDESFKQKIKTYSGFTAQIIQHEIDHCNGIII